MYSASLYMEITSLGILMKIMGGLCLKKYFTRQKREQFFDYFLKINIKSVSVTIVTNRYHIIPWFNLYLLTVWQSNNGGDQLTCNSLKMKGYIDFKGGGYNDAVSLFIMMISMFSWLFSIVYLLSREYR